MTKAEIITATRNLVNEISTDSGALLSDTGNLLDFIDDAMEQLVIDLLPHMPLQFCGTEDIDLVADQANYTLTAEWWMIYKIERNVTGKKPIEIDIIDPLEHQYHTNVGDTEANPMAVYILGDTIYFVKTPSTAATDYAKVYFVRPEATTIVTAGPTYIPRAFHRCIGYYAASLVAMSVEGMDMAKFLVLYQNRLQKGLRLWTGRYQSEPRFVRESYQDRKAYSGLDRAVYDIDWP